MRYVFQRCASFLDKIIDNFFLGNPEESLVLKGVQDNCVRIVDFKLEDQLERCQYSSRSIRKTEMYLEPRSLWSTPAAGGERDLRYFPDCANCS